MQRGTKAELQMLRELGWLVLPTLECHFCHRPILEPSTAGAMTFGHRRHPTLSHVKFSVHHFNKDREDNRRGNPRISSSTFLIWFDANLRMAHSVCHKQFHADERRPLGEPEPDDVPF